MKIKMIDSARMAGTPAAFTFHKGRTYYATPATNQPEWKENGLVFVEKTLRDGRVVELLLSRADYVAATH